MTRRQHFQRGSGCYTCISCRKLTRDTGNGEGSLRLCADCLKEAERENHHSDNGHEGDPATCQLCDMELGQ
jgi:hypothetical protein